MPNFGICRFAFEGTSSSCSSTSRTKATGIIGGVIAILYARTIDSAKCSSECGASSHLVMSRTNAAAS